MKPAMQVPANGTGSVGHFVPFERFLLCEKTAKKIEYRKILKFLKIFKPYRSDDDNDVKFRTSRGN